MAFPRRKRYGKKRFVARKKAMFRKKVFRPRRKADEGYLEKLTSTARLTVDAGGGFAQLVVNWLCVGVSGTHELFWDTAPGAQ